jgi:hypothetical protein
MRGEKHLGTSTKPGGATQEESGGGRGKRSCAERGRGGWEVERVSRVRGAGRGECTDKLKSKGGRGKTCRKKRTARTGDEQVSEAP